MHSILPKSALFFRKTQVGNIEIQDIRPPRFIGRDGVGGALLLEYVVLLCVCVCVCGVRL